MRLDKNIIWFFKQWIVDINPDVTFYLFGSRTIDDAKGDDIDLMILTNNTVDIKMFRPIRIEF